MSWEIALIVLTIIFILAVLEMVRETRTFKVTHYNIKSPKLDADMREKKVVVLSDLHNCSYGKENEKLVRAIAKQQPDLIFVAGDILIGKKDSSTETAERFMKRIRRIAPVYYGNGNHEQRMKEYPQDYGTAYKEYKEKLVREGIIFLENDSVSFEWEGKPVRISGLEIPLHYYKKFVGNQIKEEEIRERLGGSSKEVFEILLAHNPVHAESYAGWGADLVLSGHLHGGIVRLPFVGGAISPQAILFPKYSGGQYAVGETQVIVSKGLGTHTVNVRLFNEAEVVVLHINGAK